MNGLTPVLPGVLDEHHNGVTPSLTPILPGGLEDHNGLPQLPGTPEDPPPRKDSRSPPPPVHSPQHHNGAVNDNVNGHHSSLPASSLNAAFQADDEDDALDEVVPISGAPVSDVQPLRGSKRKDTSDLLKNKAKLTTLFRTSTRTDVSKEETTVQQTTGTGKGIRTLQFDKEESEDLNAGWKRDDEHKTTNTMQQLASSILKGNEVQHRTTSKASQHAISLVHSRFFSSGVALFILMNAIFIGLETDFNDAEVRGGAPHVGWTICEVIFTTIFLLELIVRMLCEPLKKFFSDAWNIFDSVIVTSAFVDLVTFFLASAQEGDSSSGGSNSGNLTVLRIFRIMRIARVVRLLRMFPELQLLAAGILGSARVLVWVWILLIMIIYMFAVFVTRTVAHNHRDNQEVQDLIGKLPRSMLTFFTIMTTEGWADYCRTLGSSEPFMYAVIIFFISITTFAMINVVIAVICDTTMARASQMRMETAEQKQRIEQAALIKIIDVFKKADENDDGMLTKDEFLQGLEKTDVRELLFSADVSLRDVNELFDILDTDESGSLTCQEFLDGVQRARGEARAKDLLELHCDLWKASQRGRNEMRGLREEFDTFMGQRLHHSRKNGFSVGQLSEQLSIQTSHFVKALREKGVKASAFGNPSNLVLEMRNAAEIAVNSQGDEDAVPDEPASPSFMAPTVTFGVSFTSPLSKSASFRKWS